MNGGPVAWKSKKKSLVALSTTEAEYIALALATQDALWIRSLLRQIGLSQRKPTIINENNNSAMELTKNSKINQRTKHFDVKHHFTREAAENNFIKIIRCSSEEQLTDILIKGLPEEKQNYLIRKIGLSDQN